MLHPTLLSSLLDIEVSTVTRFAFNLSTYTPLSLLSITIFLLTYARLAPASLEEPRLGQLPPSIEYSKIALLSKETRDPDLVDSAAKRRTNGVQTLPSTDFVDGFLP